MLPVPSGRHLQGEGLYKGEKHRQSAVVYKKTYKECCEGTREILMNELKTLKARQKNITAMLKAIDESENDGGKK